MRLSLARLAAVVLAASAALAEAGEEVRVFQLRYRRVREAPDIVEPLLSKSGSILLQPKLNTLTVRDDRVVLDRVARTLEGWDLPPAVYRVELQALLASTAAPTAAPTGPHFWNFGDELARLLKYRSFQELDTLVITAAEGSPVEASLGHRYAVRFTLRTGRLDPERLILSQLEFSRKEKGDAGSDVVTPLLRSTVSLKLGQTAVLGAAQSESASQALLLVLCAQRGDEP